MTSARKGCGKCAQPTAASQPTWQLSEGLSDAGGEGLAWLCASRRLARLAGHPLGTWVGGKTVQAVVRAHHSHTHAATHRCIAGGVGAGAQDKRGAAHSVGCRASWALWGRCWASLHFRWFWCLDWCRCDLGGGSLADGGLGLRGCDLWGRLWWFRGLDWCRCDLDGVSLAEGCIEDRTCMWRDHSTAVCQSVTVLWPLKHGMQVQAAAP
jgi:hypothetical protein